MSWNVEFLDEAKRDMKRLDHSAQVQVLKGIQKVAGIRCPSMRAAMENPLGIITQRI